MIKKLITIQHDLKAPKKQFNSFGKYNYRNQEDILEALKPLLYAQGLVLTLSDTVMTVGDALFVEATATISDGEKSMTTVAQAGLDLNKKGMDKAQATGASSSYARKYALNAMFLIDDTKDSDATNKHGKTQTTVAQTTTSKDPLLSNSEAYLKVVNAIKAGTHTIADVKSKYVVSSEVENKLRNL